MDAAEGKAGPDWAIQDIARMAGTTSRTLRHYGDIGLLKPSRVGSNGYRYYDAAALLQLQRILLLRELGLGLPAIAEVFRRQTDAVEALSHHLEWLGQEQDRLSRQMASVRQTIETIRRGGGMVAEKMFDGFDHTQYKDEVEERWGKDAYASLHFATADDELHPAPRTKGLPSQWILAGNPKTPIPAAQPSSTAGPRGDQNV